MYWLGLQPGDVHLNISSPGWGKHAWSNVYAPWIAGATALVGDYRRFSAKPLLEAMVRCGVTTFCAPPTVWRILIQDDLGTAPPTLRECVSAGEPLNPEVIERVRQGVGHHGQGRLRADGDHRADRELPRPAGQARVHGTAAARLRGGAASIVGGVRPPTEGEICLDLSRRPLGLMTGYRGDPALTAAATRGGYFHTRRRREQGRRGLHHLCRPHRRRLQGLRLPDLAVRAGERADRARGRGRGRGRPFARHDPAGRAQGVRDRSRRLGTDGRHRGRDPEVHAETGSLPTSASGGSSSPSCRRRSQGRSAGSSCVARRNPATAAGGEAGPGRRPGEFWEEDFPGLKG